jgi:hypothetical protein
MLRSGELSGEHEDGDERKPWRVHKWNAHALRDRHREDWPPTHRERPPKAHESRENRLRVLPSCSVWPGTSNAI